MKRKQKIIEWLIKRWMPQKDGKSQYRLSRIRGPYRKACRPETCAGQCQGMSECAEINFPDKEKYDIRMKQATPEQVEEEKELIKNLVYK